MITRTTRRNALLTLGLAMCAATGLAGRASAQGIELTVSSWVPPTHFLHKEILVPFGETVAKATEGRVKVRILPAALGSPPQHFELARKGAADITWGNFTYEPDRFVSLWFAEFAFAGTNAEAASVALWRVYDKHLKSNAAFEGVKMLGVGLLGGGQIHHGKKAIVSPADLANQKVRMGGPIQKRMLEALGVVPVAAPAPKAYELLQSGVIDGSLHSMESIVNFRLEESLRHHTIVPEGFYDATFFVAINGAKWNALSAADKAAIEKFTGEALSAEWGRQFDKQNTAAIAKLKSTGHTFSEASPAVISKIKEVNNGMIKDWLEAAKKGGGWPILPPCSPTIRPPTSRSPRSDRVALLSMMDAPGRGGTFPAIPASRLSIQGRTPCSSWHCACGCWSKACCSSACSQWWH